MLMTASIALIVSRPEGPLPWTAWPAAFGGILLADFIEYVLHRWPMHKRRRLTRRLFRSHTIDHHRFFTHEAMDMRHLREVFSVASSKFVIAISIVSLVLVVGLISLAFGTQVGMFAGGALGLFVTAKQVLHIAFHFPEEWMGLPVLRSRAFQAMRRHHTIHHNPRLMRKYNFNIGTPLFDALFGTLTWTWPERRT